MSMPPIHFYYVKAHNFNSVHKDRLFSKKGVFTDYGLLFRNEGIEFREIYDGQVFPQYSYYGDELFTVEMEYNGKREYLYLAEETRSIDKALARLGVKDYSDCKLQICDFNIESKIWLIILSIAVLISIVLLVKLGSCKARFSASSSSSHCFVDSVKIPDSIAFRRLLNALLV